MSSYFVKMTNHSGDGAKVLEVAMRNAGDWSSFWGNDRGEVSKAWANSRIDMFLSQGASTGARWPGYNALEKRYYVPVKSWLLGGGKMSQGSVLRYTRTPQSRGAATSPVKERLFPAMCVPGAPHYVYTVKGNIVELGTDLPYAWNHDQGIGGWTRKWKGKHARTVTILTPRRPLTRFGEPFIETLRNMLGMAASNMGGKVGVTDGQYAANFKLNGGKIGL